MQQNISVFKCLDKSSYPKKAITLNEALEIIKNHPQKDLITKAKTKDGGKSNPIKEYPAYDRVEKRVVENKRNFYQHVKSTQLPCVTWNCVIDKNTRRKKKNIKKPSSYIYCDVDDFQNIIDNPNNGISNKEDAIALVWKTLTDRGFKFIKAVWRSVGGGGFGFLVKVDGLTIENFKSTWISLANIFEQRGIILDPQTKDITRPNVLSYDPEIFIKKDSDVEAYPAVEEEQRNTQVVKTESIPEGLSNDILQYLLDKMYEDKKNNWQNGRLTYKFYFTFFSLANHWGVDLYEALDFLKSRESDYIALFKYRSIDAVVFECLKSVELNYGHQKGIVEVDIPEDLPLKDRYTIEGLYQPYDGDTQIKLEYIWFNLRKKDYLKDKKIKIVARIAKENGIPKKKYVDFLCNIGIIPDEFDLTNIDYIYGNFRIHYGVKKVLTPEAIEERKRLLYSFAEAKGKRVIERITYEGDVNSKLAQIHQEARVRYPEYTEDIFLFLGHIFKRAKSLAITVEQVIDFLSEIYNTSYETVKHLKEIHKFDSIVKPIVAGYKKVVKYAKEIGSSFYEYDSWRLGIELLDKLTIEKVKERYNIREEHFLDEGQYISDLKLTDINRTIIWGNTSQGKTTWICEHMSGKRLMLVPIIPLLKGIQNSHNASVFWEKEDNVKEGDDLIVCTYSSFPKLLKVMSDWEDYKISDYRLFFDEEHNFAVSAAKNYRNYELNFILDNEHLFKSSTMLTGTMFPVMHPTLLKYDIIRVNWKKVPPKKFKRIKYNDILYSIGSKLSREGKNVIYLQNKKEEGKLGELIDYLTSPQQGWDRNRIWTINADEKNSDHFNKLIENQWIDDEVDILICTSVIVEGVNIYNPDVKTIHFMSNEGIVNYEQMVNRFRAVYNHQDPDCMIYFYKKIERNPVEPTDHFDSVDFQNNLIRTAEKQMALFHSAYLTGDSYTRKITQRVFQQNILDSTNFFRNKDGVWVIDYLAIANIAYMQEKQYAYRDIEFTTMMLHEYNWQFYGEETIETTKSREEADNLRASKEYKREELRADVMVIMNTILEDGEETTIEKINDKNKRILEQSERPSYEIGLRSKVKWLCNCMEFEDAYNLVLDWIDEHNMSDTIWNKIRRQITIQLAKELKALDDGYDVTTKFVKSLVKYLVSIKEDEEETGQKRLFTASELKSVIKRRVKHAPELQNIHITNEVAIEIISEYMDISTYAVNDKIKYYLEGFKIENDVVTFSHLLQEWVEDCYENGVMLTSEELAQKLNMIRKDLPLLSKFTLNSNKAMRLIHDYYGFERASTRGEDNTYKFTSLVPNEIMREVTVKQDNVFNNEKEVMLPNGKVMDIDGINVKIVSFEDSNYKIKYRIPIIPLRNVETSEKHVDDMTYDEKKLYNHQTQLNSLTYYLTISKQKEGKEIPF